MYDKKQIACEILSSLQASDEKFGALSCNDALDFVVSAENDIAMYLRVPLPLENVLVPKLKELSKMKLAGEYTLTNQLKSRSYQEGEISESEAYLTPQEQKERENALLSSLKMYRRCRIVT